MEVTALSLPMQELWRLAFSASGRKVQPQPWGRSGLRALLRGGGGSWEDVLLGRDRRRLPCPPRTAPRTFRFIPALAVLKHSTPGLEAGDRDPHPAQDAPEWLSLCLVPQRRERAAYPVCTMNTLLRALPPGAGPPGDAHALGRARGWGRPGPALLLLLASGEEGPQALRLPLPGPVRLGPFVNVAQFLSPSPFVVGWVLNYKFKLPLGERVFNKHLITSSLVRQL